MVDPAGDVVGQLPGGHLAAEVGVLGDQGGGVTAASEDDVGGADLGEEESMEEGREAGGLDTNWERDGQRRSERERDTGFSLLRDLEPINGRARLIQLLKPYGGFWQFLADAAHAQHRSSLLASNRGADSRSG